jgi:8-hydroxy-5-deazaflavin:NADPH oxidoreductase
MNADNTGLVIGHTFSGAAALAKKVPKARVVCAFNTVPSEVLFGVYEARRKANRPSLVCCGDDAHSKEVAAELIRDVGFDPVDAENSRRFPAELRGSSASSAGNSLVPQMNYR